MSGKKGRSGKRPTPTNILRLRGTYREDRHGDRAGEPQPKLLKDHRAPSWLSIGARRHWRRLVGPLVRSGLLGETDSIALAVLASELFTYTDCVKQSHASTDPKTAASWRRQAAAACANVRGLLAEFGMTPSSRTRVRVLPTGEPDLQALIDEAVRAERRERRHA